jgi:hypothetical protein
MTDLMSNQPTLNGAEDLRSNTHTMTLKVFHIYSICYDYGLL